MPARQRGVVLVLIVLTLLAITGTFLLTSIVNSSGPGQRVLQNVTSGSQVLVAAKQALLGYAVGALNSTAARPGWLPLPDTLSNGNYNGIVEPASCLDGSAANGMPALVAAATKVANLRCLGRLPWSTLGLAIDGVNERDALGLMPWYAVSPNLADPEPGTPCMALLNPVTAATTPVAFSCPTSTGAAWPWLRVCDGGGRLISDRVAFVLIIPGEAIATTGRTQQRSIAASGMNPNGIGNPSDFLDAIPTPAGWAALPPANRCATFDNAGLTGEFIAAENSAVFNDQVIFVTVDELMQEVEKRVAQDVREGLVTARAISASTYSWLVPIAALPTAPPATFITDSFIASTGVSAGFVPFHIGGEKFKTELSWSITGADTPAPATSSPTFPCTVSGFGARQCRIRTAGNAPIPRTINLVDIAPYKSSAVATPSVVCNWNTTAPDTKIECDPYTLFSQTTPVTYWVQHRACCAGGYTDFGLVAGNTTRTVSLLSLVPSGTTSWTGGSATTHLTRTVTTVNAGEVQIDMQDRWTPDAISGVIATGTLPSPGSFLSESGSGNAVANIRRYAALPTWYLTQRWYETIYAAMSLDARPPSSIACAANCLISGNRTNIDLVVISTGEALTGQLRYSGAPTAASFVETPNSTVQPDAAAANRTFASSLAPRNRTTYADSVVTFPR